jgi:hypothetical protein
MPENMVFEMDLLPQHAGNVAVFPVNGCFLPLVKIPPVHKNIGPVSSLSAGLPDFQIVE